VEVSGINHPCDCKHFAASSMAHGVFWPLTPRSPEIRANTVLSSHPCPGMKHTCPCLCYMINPGSILSPAPRENHVQEQSVLRNVQLSGYLNPAHLVGVWLLAVVPELFMHPLSS
jgi:hypothetical protein